MRYLPVFFIFLALSATASASDLVHSFYCGLLDQTPAQQVAIRIEDRDLASGIAEVFISNMSEKGWVPFEHSTNARVELRWAPYTKNGITIDTIVAARISLGRTGTIVMKTIRHYDQFLSAPGRIRSNLRGFNYPKGVDATYCTYGGGVPKPGVSGSN